MDDEDDGIDDFISYINGIVGVFGFCPVLYEAVCCAAYCCVVTEEICCPPNSQSSQVPIPIQSFSAYAQDGSDFVFVENPELDVIGDD